MSEQRAGGYGPSGARAALDAAARRFGWTDAQRREATARSVERDLSEARQDALRWIGAHLAEDPGIFEAARAIDEAEYIEASAVDLARRVREHERIRERALEILDDEDGEDG
jgi:hypothetical protein